MRRSFVLIVLGLVIVAAVVAGAVTWLSGRNSNGNVNTPPVGTNTNSTDVSTPPVVKGDITVKRSATYRDITFTVDTALRTEAFKRTQAPDGSQFLVLFLEPFATDPSDDPLPWASREIKLKTGNADPAGPTEVSLPSKADVAGGYLWFTVPDGSGSYALVFGTGSTAQTLDLGI